jgi:hypothetical protein
MRRLAVSFTVLSALALAGCGGGGGGGTGGGGGGGAPPAPVYANTASQFYLPLHNGNSWTFNSGGSIRDTGPTLVSCNCTINGTTVEALNLVEPDGATVSGTLYFAKAQSSHSSVLSVLVGLANPGEPMEIVTDGVTYGIPIMDDAAVQGESWTLAGETSTITSVGATQSYPGGETIRSVNSDTLSDTSGTISFGFAQGVGFTSLIDSGETITLTAFSIDVADSQSLRPLRTVRASGTARASTVGAVLRTLL